MRTNVMILAAVAALTSCGSGGAGNAPATAATPAQAAFAAPLDSTTMLVTGSGLRFRDISVGNGPVVSAGATVSVYYVGTLLNGRQFDAALPGGTPIRFRVGVGRVIRGWDEGLVGMRQGGKRQLLIPPDLGYGARGTGPIPPNATLVFTIEVVRVE